MPPSPASAVNLTVSLPILDLYTEKALFYRHGSDFSPPFEKIKKSPLRFTWEYKTPVYYGADREGDMEKLPVAVISNGHPGELPDEIGTIVKDYRRAGVFGASTGIFRYKPFVTIYVRE